MAQDGFSSSHPPTSRRKALPRWLIPFFIIDAIIAAGVLYWVFGEKASPPEDTRDSAIMGEVRGAPIDGDVSARSEDEGLTGDVDDVAVADVDDDGFSDWEDAEWEDVEIKTAAAPMPTTGPAVDREKAASFLFGAQQELPRPKISRPEFSDYKPANFKDIGNWKYKRSWTGGGITSGNSTAQIPGSVLKWNGTAIAIQGFMQPLELDDANRVRSFMLMRNQAACCYGAPITLADWIEVTAPEGTTYQPMLHKPITIAGKLEVGEKRVDGFAVSVFRMTPDEVVPPGESL